MNKKHCKLSRYKLAIVGYVGSTVSVYISIRLPHSINESTNCRTYQALLATEGVEVEFTEEAIAKMAGYAVNLNETTDNIGARRLHTILETLLEELLFESAEMQMGHIDITEKYVEQKLEKIVENEDLSHYIL